MPDLHFEIQDVHRHQFNAAQATLPDSLKSRISFKEHSFFSPQEPDSAAVAYFLRQVLHDWADEDAIKIIRTMVPALEANPKATLFINEMLIRDFGECETALDEQDARRYDMCMMVYLNAKERDRAAWEKLFKMADERFEVVNVIRQEKPGSSMAFLEFKLNV